MNRVLIIGLGSIGQRHYRILKKLHCNIKIISQRDIYQKHKIQFTKKEIDHFDPEYVIISSKTENHFKDLFKINKILNNKIILVEKPLYHKEIKKKINLNNIVLIGYNMRFNPIVNYLKKYFQRYKDKIYSINLYCGSYLPNWRKNISYQKSASASKLSGGVTKDLSHDIDYISWIFGDIKNIRVINKKVSVLKINSFDMAYLIGKSKKTFVNISLNYFSIIPHRFIIIDCQKETLHIDLVYKKVSSKKINKKIVTKHWNFDRNECYRKMHLAIFNKEFENFCTYEEGLKYLRF